MSWKPEVMIGVRFATCIVLLSCSRRESPVPEPTEASGQAATGADAEADDARLRSNGSIVLGSGSTIGDSGSSDGGQPGKEPPRLLPAAPRHLRVRRMASATRQPALIFNHPPKQGEHTTVGAINRSDIPAVDLSGLAAGPADSGDNAP